MHALFLSILFACGTPAEVPAPEVVTPPTAIADDTPLPEYAVGEYPGTYLAVCQRMVACECAARPTPQACAHRAEEAIFSTRAVMAENGLEVPAPTEEQLAAVANGECSPLCNEVKASFGL